MNNRSDRNNDEYLLSRFVDGQLDGHEEASLLARLAEDADLREQLHLYQELDGALAPKQTDALASVDYDAQREQIMAAIARETLLGRAPRRGARRQVVLRTLAAAAILLVVASVALLVFRQVARHDETRVSVTLVGGPSAPTGPAEFAVRLRRMEDPPEPPRRQTGLPRGMVLVSIGPEPEDGDDFASAGPFGI